MESPQYLQPLVVACIASEVDMWTFIRPGDHDVVRPFVIRPRRSNYYCFNMVTFLILAQKKDVDTIYSIDFFFQPFIYISYRERNTERGGYGHIKSFEHFLCPLSEGFWPLILYQTAVLLFPERNIIWTIFLCAPRVRDLNALPILDRLFS